MRGCFRLERSPGGIHTHWKAPPFHGAHPERSFDLATGTAAMRKRPANSSCPSPERV